MNSDPVAEETQASTSETKPAPHTESTTNMRFGTTPAFPMIGGYGFFTFFIEAFSRPQDPVVLVITESNGKSRAQMFEPQNLVELERMFPANKKWGNFSNIFSVHRFRLNYQHFSLLERCTKFQYGEWSIEHLDVNSPLTGYTLWSMSKYLHKERIAEMLAEYRRKRGSLLGTMAEGGIMGGLAGAAEAFFTEAADVTIHYSNQKDNTGEANKGEPTCLNTRFLERTLLGSAEGALWGAGYGLAVRSVKICLCDMLGLGGWWMNVSVDIATDCAMRGISEILPSVKRTISHCNGLSKPASDRPAFEKPGTSELLKSTFLFIVRFLISVGIGALVRRSLPPTEKGWLSTVAPVIPSLINSLVRNVLRVSLHFWK